MIFYLSFCESLIDFCDFCDFFFATFPRSSFAYPTLKDRVPTIICKTIDALHRGRATRRTEQEREDLREVVARLARLRCGWLGAGCRPTNVAGINLSDGLSYDAGGAGVKNGDDPGHHPNQYR